VSVPSAAPIYPEFTRDFTQKLAFRNHLP
jgi:hypothetical protein